ncbi:kumamolisin [Methylacidimicrobium cyclopophantes]|uniref:Kumamolisin n=1 Tax=Methylacidimicrobium cyclopophantes TaxID=1041766 RepID=A0A5E6MG45_9BACT|nr:S53 family peptidase [Methylacidimicrobium cyclopophantes]VVM08250.1 kumamolisin [Methylacidimicrobium cyclopophantes]
MPQDGREARGEERLTMSGARLIGPLDGSVPLTFTLLLRRRSSLPERIEGILSPAEIGRRFGADPASVFRVKEEMARLGFEVLGADSVRRTLSLRAPADLCRRVFGIELFRYQGPAGAPFHTYRGECRLPDTIAPLVEAVLGLDTRPLVRPRIRIFPPAQAPAISCTPPQVGELYQFPSDLDGTGQRIALLEFGGGYRIEDLKVYFTTLGLPVPDVRAISVDGTENAPSGNPDGADGEVALDIEIAGSLASGAELLVFFAPNTDIGFYDAILEAVHGGWSVSVLSISWGEAESLWPASSLRAVNGALQEAALAGVSILCAAGDQGSSDGVDDGLAHVDFPASSPYVLGCGGTRLLSSGGRIVEQTVWNRDGGATGGGVSALFPLPPWQKNAGVPPSVNPGAFCGRGVPDAAGDADPSTGYRVRIDSQDLVFGGTSAVAPLWAALIARWNEALGEPLGFANPALYERVPRSAFFEITSGTNGAYVAGAGWNPCCTGLGSPEVRPSSSIYTESTDEAAAPGWRTLFLGREAGGLPSRACSEPEGGSRTLQKRGVSLEKDRDRAGGSKLPSPGQTNPTPAASRPARNRRPLASDPSCHRSQDDLRRPADRQSFLFARAVHASIPGTLRLPKSKRSLP